MFDEVDKEAAVGCDVACFDSSAGGASAISTSGAGFAGVECSAVSGFSGAGADEALLSAAELTAGAFAVDSASCWPPAVVAIGSGWVVARTGAAPNPKSVW